VVLVPEPEFPSTEVTFEMDAEIPASVDDDAGTDSGYQPPAPPRPPSMPALPRVTAATPAVELVAPAAESVSVAEIEPSLDAPVERDGEPSIPSFAIPSMAAPPSQPPMAAAPEPLVFAPFHAPALAAVSIPPPIAPRYEPPAFVDHPVAVAPSAPSANLAKWKIMGASIIAAAAIVTGGQIYLAKIRRAPDPRREVPAVLVPTPTPPAVAAPVLAPPVVDASSVTGGDAVAAPGDAAAAAGDAGALVLAVDDAGALAAGDAAARPALIVDASTPAPGATSWDVAVFGASNDPPHNHPRRREMGRMEEALESEVRRCIGPGSTRHVRMSVVYDGATGQPAGPCLEGVMRAHPVPPFTDSEFESHFIFNTSEDEEE
jgi:hypothetical protein